MRFTKTQIEKALRAAGRLVKSHAQPAEKVAAILSPYMGCTEIQGLSGRVHEDVRSAIFATMGDAYRREQKVELAAKWYRRASAVSSGHHATVYAHMVCKHQLSEFYEDALTILQDHQRGWQLKPAITRFLLRVKMWFNAEQRELMRSEKQDLQFLVQNAVSISKAA
jgi:hypothetical protein